MHRRWLFAATLAMLMASQPTVWGDWKSHMVSKVVGGSAREAIEDAMEDAAKDAAFDAALSAVVRDDDWRDSLNVDDAMRKVVVGSTASAAIQTAMTVAASAQQAVRPRNRWSAVDVLPLTCAQAWEKSSKSYPRMFSIVETLVRVSLANRDLTFPDTHEAGLEAGKGISEDCKADPDALLFAIVDKHVRHLAGAVAPH